MTEKQKERIKTKIKKIRAALLADKKRHGGFFDDSRGIRYAPPSLYIQLGDYTGGLRYMNWFSKNFPDDCGFPEFLFEWTIILFQTGRLKEAEKKAFQAFCRNTYMFDKFFNKVLSPVEKYEGSNIEHAEYAEQSLKYSHTQPELAEFTAWLNHFITSEKFIQKSNKILEIVKRLKNEMDTETRGYLIGMKHQLINEF